MCVTGGLEAARRPCMVPDPSVAPSPAGRILPAGCGAAFRELEGRFELRPKEDLAPLENAYRFAAAQHGRQTAAPASPTCPSPSRSRVSWPR